MTAQSAAPAPQSALTNGAAQGMLLMIAAIGLFAVMDATIKGLRAEGYGTMQIVFFRSFFGLIPLAVLIARSGGLRAIATRRPFAHGFRALVGLTSMATFFYAYGELKLADAYAIYFAAPIFMTALAAAMLGEAVGWRRWTAVLVGFGGVMVMLQPGGGLFNLGGIACVIATVTYAVAAILVRLYSRTETTASLSFWFTLTCAAFGAATMAPEWRTPDLWGAAGFLAVGLLGGCAQLCFTQSLRQAPVALVAPLEYSGMFWAVGLGYLFWDEIPSTAVFVGGTIVIASGLYILRREQIRSREENARQPVAETPAQG